MMADIDVSRRKDPGKDIWIRLTGSEETLVVSSVGDQMRSHTIGTSSLALALAF